MRLLYPLKDYTHYSTEDTGFMLARVYNANRTGYAVVVVLKSGVNKTQDKIIKGLRGEARKCS